MGRPTQQEMLVNALAQLDIARAALSRARAEMNSDWIGVERGVGWPREIADNRVLARAAITAANGEIDSAQTELSVALRHFTPAETDQDLGEHPGERVDEVGGR